MRKLKLPKILSETCPAPSAFSKALRRARGTAVKTKQRPLTQHQGPKAHRDRTAGRGCEGGAVEGVLIHHLKLLAITKSEGSSLTRPTRMGPVCPQSSSWPRSRGRACLQVLQKEGCVGLTPYCHSLNRGTYFVAEKRRFFTGLCQRACFY